MKSTNCKSSYNYSVEARTPVSSIVTWMVAAISITTAIAQPAEAATSIAVAIAITQALAVVAVVAHGVRSGESDLVL